MRVLGLMSGTSVDAIDAAIIDATLVDDEACVVVIGHGEFPWPDELRSQILGVLPPSATDVAQVTRLNTLVGQRFAEVAADMVEAFGPVELVGSHGQTVFHWVEDGHARGTLQLGEPAWISARLGVPVVANLRAADIAVGGQGAPLVAVLDALLFGDVRSAVVNLGGIANATIVAPGGVEASFDTGPANCLMDALVASETGRGYDKDGAIADSGAVSQRWLGELRSLPWLALSPPKSTGREVFTLDWALASRPVGLGLADSMATLLELTATTLAGQLLPFSVDRTITSGGGVRNGALLRRIAELVGPLHTTDEFGVPSDAKEAVLCALIAWFTANRWSGVPLATDGRTTTGADRPVVLGATSGWPADDSGRPVRARVVPPGPAVSNLRSSRDREETDV